MMTALCQDLSSFGWGLLMNRVEDDSKKLLMIIEDYDKVTLEMVKKNTSRTFQDHAFPFANPLAETFEIVTITPSPSNASHLAMFDCQSRSRMITNRIQNSLTLAPWDTLFSKRKHFTWTAGNGSVSYDGPTMLFMLVSSINPSTRVGVSDLKTSPRESKLTQFQYNVTNLTR